MMTKKLMLCFYVCLSLFFKSQAQTISGTFSVCPNQINNELVYNATDFPAGCKLNWEIGSTGGEIFVNNVSVGNKLSDTDSRTINVRWNKEPKCTYNTIGEAIYPTSYVSVSTVGLSPNKSISIPVRINSVAGLKIPTIDVSPAPSGKIGLGVPTNTMFDYTLDNNSDIIVTIPNLRIYYNQNILPINSDLINQFVWILPSGWSAIGYAGSTFVAGNQITLKQPCSNLVNLSELKVAPSTHNGCNNNGNNGLQTGDYFILVLKKDVIISSMTATIQSIAWSSANSFRINASTNRTYNLTYQWYLPAGFTQTNTGMSGNINTSVPYIDVTVSSSSCITSTTGLNLTVKSGTCLSSPTNINIPFVLPTIVGSSTICTEGTYTISNLPNDGLPSVITWSNSTSLQLTGGQGTASATFVTTGGKPLNSAWLKATVSHNGCVYNTPIFSISSPGVSATIDYEATYFTVGKTNNYSAQIECGTPPYASNWWLQQNSPTYIAPTLVSTTPFLSLKCGSASTPLKVNGIQKIGVKSYQYTLSYGVQDSYGSSFNPNNIILVSEGPLVVGSGIELVKSSLTDLNEINSASNDIVLSPNPANDYLEVKTPNQVAENYSVEIFNIAGNIVYSNTQGLNLSKIPISKFCEGIYIVKVTNSQNSYQKQLIIKH